VQPRSFALLAFVALAACGSVDGPPRAGPSTTTPVRDSTTSIQLQLPAGSHTCVEGKGAPPGPKVEWAVDGQPGNERELPAAPGRSLHLDANVLPNAVVNTVELIVTPADDSSEDGPVIASFQSWGPGSHQVRIRWDGRDQNGEPIPAGRYRLFGKVLGSAYWSVPCVDGSPNGVEINGGEEEDGLGLLVVEPS
jgi:hypothetical protein